MAAVEYGFWFLNNSIKHCCYILCVCGMFSLLNGKAQIVCAVYAMGVFRIFKYPAGMENSSAVLGLSS